MDLWKLPARDLRPVLVRERAELVAWLKALTPQEWHTPTAVPGWSVKDLALHLLDDDLGWLSRDRDRDRSGLLDMHSHNTFVTALAAKNEAWVRGAHQLSSRVIISLLEWAGQEMDEHCSTMDLHGRGEVMWADDGPVPVWFDIAQDLTERWVHQMQMRLAVDKVGHYARDHLSEVMNTFVWAFPHQYRPDADAGTSVAIDLSAGGKWGLTSVGGGRWALEPGTPIDVSAAVRATDEAGWRWLTGATIPAGGLRSVGPEYLIRPLLGVRGIIV